MLTRGKMDRGVVEIVDTESLVPSEHLLRKIDRAVNWERLYDMVEELYCEDNGRPGIDPIVLFKMVLIQHLYGLSSLRRTAEEVRLNVAYRWFLGYTLNDETPHFSTISYNFRHRFTNETIEKIFAWILEEAAGAGCLSPEAVFIDGTHIKASANIHNKIKMAVPTAAVRYHEELMAEINADREVHGKAPFDDDDKEPPKPTKKRDNTSKKKLARRKKTAKEREVTCSTTDPDSGLFHKGEHKRCFAYEAHTACDKHGFVLETVVTAGNVHDSVAFDDVYDRLTEAFPEVETVVADSAYKTPHICKKVFDDGRVLSTAYKRPQTKKGGHEWWKYVYDEYNDIIICPEYQTLHYATTNREGYREYKSRSNICEKCPTRHLCTDSKSFEKTVTRHVWQDYVELAEDARYTPKYQELYARRKETIERVFADAKEKHAMRYTHYRGLTQVTNWVKLKFASMNLKKLANWKWRTSFYHFILLVTSCKTQRTRHTLTRNRVLRQAENRLSLFFLFAQYCVSL
jgi:transposase